MLPLYKLTSCNEEKDDRQLPHLMGEGTKWFSKTFVGRLNTCMNVYEREFLSHGNIYIYIYKSLGYIL